jgi:hypothetical protein
MRKTLLTVSALMAVAATAGAQSASAIRLRLDPGSELTIEGTSSLHAFHCKTNKINAYVDVDPGYTKDLTKVARVNQKYLDFPTTDIRNGGKFKGFMVEGVVAF